MKASTLKHIASQFRLLRTVISNYVALYPHHTILISIEVALQNIYPYGDTKEMEDRINKTVKFINSVYANSTYDHFLHYIKDEVEMIVTGNIMSEDIEDEIQLPYNPDQEVCPKCGEYMIHHKNGVCPC